MTPLPPTLRFIERDWLSSNQMLFVEPDGATLIDTGYGTRADFTVALVERVLAEVGRAERGLTRLINTHLHSDHCGANAALQRRYRCPTLVPHAEFDAVRRWDEDALTYRATAQVCERFHADGFLSDGDEITLGGMIWRVHAAPGHDPHSLMLHCPEHRLLISADVLWQNGFGIIFPELSGNSGFAEQKAALELIASLDVGTVLPGHGPMFHDVPEALERAFARLAVIADPRRNARNALKALLKFRLLEQQQFDADRLAEELAGASVMTNAAALIGMSLDAAIAWALTELERQGQLRREGSRIFNP
ncbi:MAG TPA: MBL fold metallo-hydrolase [Quisquiliibacterium sp.]|nr:MBL fold metallo-hydrolase [Quisquiliibacterium sp.]HQD82519.1 MBL fold metallo-hydrolase [Quisquiliibacterium sp.]HQN11450.1 MBL fold metallo-hydrolase [Quisquiliibacterium sp.]HQP68035.1 MBL fold metallo-hydrolase [Quisquiliibacterium sp.]